MPELTESEKNTNSRFIEVYRFFKEEGRVKNKSEFAQLLDMPKEYMSHAEQNKRAIPPHFIIRLYKRLDINDKWLMFGEGSMFTQEGREKHSQVISGNKIKGSGNALGINNQAGAGDLHGEIEKLRFENKLLLDQITKLEKDKENLMALLMKK